MLMLGNCGHQRAIRLLPFAAAVVSLTLNCQLVRQVKRRISSVPGLLRQSRPSSGLLANSGAGPLRRVGEYHSLAPRELGVDVRALVLVTGHLSAPQVDVVPVRELIGSLVYLHPAAAAVAALQL
jgi:hypothetical protein